MIVAVVVVAVLLAVGAIALGYLIGPASDREFR